MFMTVYKYNHARLFIHCYSSNIIIKGSHQDRLMSSVNVSLIINILITVNLGDIVGSLK